MYEPDQRHAEIIMKNTGVDQATKSAVTPGVRQTSEKDDEDELPPRQTTMYRGTVARANYGLTLPMQQKN